MSGGETEEIEVEKNCSYQDKTERGRVSEKEKERENEKDRQVDVTSQDPGCLEAPAMPFNKLTSSSRWFLPGFSFLRKRRSDSHNIRSKIHTHLELHSMVALLKAASWQVKFKASPVYDLG